MFLLSYFYLFLRMGLARMATLPVTMATPLNTQRHDDFGANATYSNE